MGPILLRDSLLVFSIRRIVPETQAAERRTWNSKPSEEMSVTKGDGVVMVEVVVEAESTVIAMCERRACKSTSLCTQCFGGEMHSDWRCAEDKIRT